MSQKETESQDILASLKSKHKDILEKIEKLSDALSNLRYEGKLALPKNISSIDKIVVFFKKELIPHIHFDEKVVFPFLEIHVPKLDPLLRFLRSEHQEFLEGFKSFEALLQKLKTGTNRIQRDKSIEQLRDKGLYLICLMRTHITTESENVYRVIDQQLTKPEKQQFLNDYKYINGL